MSTFWMLCCPFCFAALSDRLFLFVQDYSDSEAEPLDDIGGGAPPVRRKVATDVDAGGQAAPATAPGRPTKKTKRTRSEVADQLCKWLVKSTKLDTVAAAACPVLARAATSIPTWYSVRRPPTVSTVSMN